ncbi:hypothetical protein ABZ383_26390 [Streptomyces sp. NPDC005900]|uniref:hypothetical protein n=1 Tax=Streptomyces sp. NPDC005900 TaxID=3154569 RepID=UPI0033D85B44
MRTPADIHIRPAAVIRTGLMITTARRYFHPFSGQSHPTRTATAVEVEACLHGEPLPGAADLARAASEVTPATVTAIHAWALTPPAGPTAFRQRLALVAAADRVTSRDIPTLVAAVDGWQRTHHLGAIKDRITATADVLTRIDQGPRIYRGASQARYLLRLRTTQGRILVWPARPGPGGVPEQGTTITIRGTVTAHDRYGDTAQTYITRCAWKPADTP